MHKRSKGAMRTPLHRRALLAVAVAVAAMAATASSASALEVENEATGDHCSAVTYVNHGSGTGGCPFSASNEGRIELGTPLGMIDCDNIFQGRVGEDGSGFIFAASIFNCSPHTVDECKEAGIPNNWPIYLTSETMLQINFCVVAFGFLTINCNLPGLTFRQITHTSAEVSTGGVHRGCDTGSGNSVRGHWLVSSPAPGLEVMD